MDVITLKNMDFFGHTGVLPEEEENGQLFTVTAELFFDEIRGAETDRLEDTTNYAELYALIRELVENDIRTMEVSNHVSPIAALDFVREAMVAQQQEMGRDGGVVMDGRDIGTVVFPNAELKVFVTASAEVRAQRRYDELKGKGMEADYADILKNVTERDYIDSHRAVSPLKQADDALLLDNSNMTIPEQKEWLMQRFRERTAI